MPVVQTKEYPTCTSPTTACLSPARNFPVESLQVPQELRDSMGELLGVGVGGDGSMTLGPEGAPEVRSPQSWRVFLGPPHIDFALKFLDA